MIANAGIADWSMFIAFRVADATVQASGLGPLGLFCFVGLERRLI